jgi:CHAT domain-containing protein
MHTSAGPAAASAAAGGRQEADDRSARELLAASDRLASQNKVNDARELYRAAAAQARAEGSAALESRALSGVGRMLVRGANYADAQITLERALALAESAGDQTAAALALRALGSVAENRRAESEARGLYDRAAEAARSGGDEVLRARILHSIAAMSSTPGPESVRLMQEVVDIGRRLGNRSLEADGLHSLGDHLFVAGEFALAMERLQEAAAICESLNLREELGRIYTSMGRLNRRHGRPEAAIEYYAKAVAIQRDIGDTIGVIQSLNATAIAYAVMGRFDAAIKNYDDAYALALETRTPRIIDFMRGNLAGGLLDAGEYQRSALLLEEVLKGQVGPYAGVRHSQLAYAYLMLGRLEDARTHAEEAVALTLSRPTELPPALITLARVKERLGDRAAALADAQRAITTIEDMRAKLVPLDFMKQGYSEANQSAYTFIIGLHHRAGQAARALEVSELARARAFLDLLATRDVRLKEASAAEVAELKKIRDGLDALGIDPDDGNAIVSSTATPPTAAGREAGELLSRWKSARPEHLSFVTARPLPAADIVATARRSRSSILTYWLGADELFIWVVSQDGRLEMKRVGASRRRIDALVAELGTSASARRPAGPMGREQRQAGPDSMPPWRALHDLLIEPVKPLLPAPGTRLMIIPHGSLQRLSFAALQNKAGRYLLEDYAVQYAPAAALLALTASSPPEAADARRYLLVADPALPPVRPGDPALTPLPGSRAEVRAIARLLPTGASTILLGAQADSRAVAEAMTRASVVHLAAHGVMRDEEPLDSYLALGHAPGSPGNGRVTAGDIYGLDLRAEMVVLGACQSGGGPVTGEGLSALVRAFFYAGTRSIVASVWDVPDETSSRILPAFYAGWLRRGQRAESLRAAQLQMLADLRAGKVKVRTRAGELSLPEHPALWAGFILLGEG